MFDKEGVVSKTYKESKMFHSPSHDTMTTGHYNTAGCDHGVGIPARVGKEKVGSKQTVPTQSKAWKYVDFDE